MDNHLDDIPIGMFPLPSSRPAQYPCRVNPMFVRFSPEGSIPLFSLFFSFLFFISTFDRADESNTPTVQAFPRFPMPITHTFRPVSSKARKKKVKRN
jgi:hypothetical protein